MTNSILIGLNVIAVVVLFAVMADMYFKERRKWGENE